MTKDELLKRLIRVEATPQRNSVLPRESIRRDMNKISIEDDDGLSEYNSFFDFEKDITELESASAQFEKISKPLEDIIPEQASEQISEQTNEIIPESFITIEEDLSAKSGDSDSFLIFEEDIEQAETTIIEDTMIDSIQYVEDQIMEENSIQTLEVEDNQDDNDDAMLNSEEMSDDTGIKFKTCKFIKASGVSCKRQAPKYNDYCSSHRKLMAKQLQHKEG